MTIVIDGTTGISGVDGTASNPSYEGTDSNTGIFFPAADTVAIGTGGTERLRVDSAGNAGLGATPSPWTTFPAFQIGGASFMGTSTDVNLTSNGYYNGAWRYIANGRAALYNQSGGLHTWYIGANNTSGAGAAWTLGTPAMTLDTFGLTLQNRYLYVNEDGANTTQIYVRSAVTAGVPAIQVTTNNPLAFWTNNTERARITSGGGFFVGMTDAAGIGFGGTPGLEFVSNISNAGVAPFQSWNKVTTGNPLFVSFYTEGGGGTLRGTIDFNRGAGQVRYNITSDATLKNIIGDSDGQKSVEILNSTRIREYAWKDDEQQKPQIGVIAQELYETYKGAVSVGGDIEKTDEEGNVTTEYKPWGVDKTAFTFHLIAGWQAHEKMIQELKAEIAALKAQP